ncbi:MAG: NUDIX hydrolase [Acidimicrobiia bacterium]
MAPVARGGRQRVPRPATAREGEAAPWALLRPEQRIVTVRDVRDRLLDLPDPPPAPASDRGLPAAVLLPLFEEDGEARLVLTKRPETMPSHRGEIAFPGGKIEPGVDRDARDAALREAEEEIGLWRATVDVIAALPVIGTVVGGFMISPFVGIVDGRPEISADSREVDRVFDVPLSQLLRDGVYREERWGPDGDGPERAVAFFELDDETVWGATARILTGFLARVVGVSASAEWRFGA